MKLSKWTLFFGALFIGLIVGALIFMASTNGPTAATTGDDAVYYDTLDELDSACMTVMAEPQGATDVKYSSTAPNGKTVARIDFKLDGCQCWWINKVTLYSEDISGIKIENPTKCQLTAGTKTWDVEYSATQGKALYYDASNGWMMNVVYVEGNVNEQVMQDVLNSIIVTRTSADVSGDN